MVLTERQLQEIESRIQPLLDSEALAVKLQSQVPDAALFVGLAGIVYEESSFDILPDLVMLRPVTNPPGIVHVCRSANLNHSNYLGVARYSNYITAEIACGRKLSSYSDDACFLHALAWHTTSLIKLRGHQTIFCPASSSVSWDTVALEANNSVTFLTLDDVPSKISIDDSKPVTTEDLVWVRNNWDRALDLRNASNSLRFGLAFNIAYTWNHTKDSRLAIASIWSGLEALFGVQTDRPVTQRLVERIAAWLDISEHSVYSLYNHRCDAVHGRSLQEDEILDVIRKSADLLRQTLIRCIETNKTTLPDWNS